MDDRIKKTMAAVFGVGESKIEEDSSPDTIESWDSLKHISLVVALEEEFGVEFDEDDIMNMMNYKLIRMLINDKLAQGKK
jgi:acyl carrier protein